MTAIVELTRGVPIQGRLVDRSTGKPLRGRFLYAPLKGNPHRPDPTVGSSTMESSMRVANLP